MVDTRARTDVMALPDRISPAYWTFTAVTWPIVRWWGRLEVTGLEHLPARGAAIVVANHDSPWDPVVIAAAGRRRRRIHALAKASLWRHRPVGWFLDKMGQIPVERGSGDAAAMTVATGCLTGGGCVGIFPEGTISRGKQLRARSGAGRLVQAVPQARIVCAAITGTVDMARFPRRPRLRVTFFAPASQPEPEESAQDLSARLTAEIRTRAPVVAAPSRS